MVKDYYLFRSSQVFDLLARSNLTSASSTGSSTTCRPPRAVSSRPGPAARPATGAGEAADHEEAQWGSHMEPDGDTELEAKTSLALARRGLLVFFPKRRAMVQG